MAKLDFFVRYPTYLAKAVAIRAPVIRREISTPPIGPEASSVESHMIRYLYGPWDTVYFTVLAYMVGKGLVRVELERGVEVFRLTARGSDAATQIAETPDYAVIAKRAQVAAAIFSNFGGSKLKQFVYENFPEIARQKLGARI